MEKAYNAQQFDRTVADLAPLVADLGGYEEALLVYQAFEESALASLAELAGAVEDRDVEVVIRQSHGLKGGARNFGASGVESAARDLEFAARENGETARLRSLLAVLSDRIGQLKEYMIALRTTL